MERYIQQMAAMEAQIQNLQGKITQMEREIQAKKKGGKTEVDTRPMTVEEKKVLSQEINKLAGENLQQILNIIEASRPLHREGQEIEIDLDTLPNETLRKLQEYVKQCEMSENLSGHKMHGAFNISDPSKLIDGNDAFDAFNSDSGRVGVRV